MKPSDNRTQRAIERALLAILAVVLLVLGALTIGPKLPLLGLDRPVYGVPVRRLPVGESARYVVFLGDVECGTLLVQVGKATGAGEAGIEGRYEGESAAVLALIYDYRFQGSVQLDVNTLLPVRSQITELKKGDQVKHTSVNFDRRAAMARVRVEKPHSGEVETESLPSSRAFDGASALLYARAIDFPPERPLRLEVIVGPHLYKILAIEAGEARIHVRAGEFDARAIDAVVETGPTGDRPGDAARALSLRLWFSDDERRLPLLLECDAFVQAFRAELVDWHQNDGARP